MATTERYFEDFVNMPCALLRTLGIDFLNISRSLLAKCLMQLYFVLSLLSCFYCTYFVMEMAVREIHCGSGNLPLILRLVDDIFHSLNGLLKSYYFFRIWKSNKSLFNRFCEIFPISMEDRREYRVNDYYWPRWITCMVYVQCGAIAVIIFSPFAATLKDYFLAILKFGFSDAKFSYHILYEEHTYIVDHQRPTGYIFIYSVLAMGTQYAVIFNICPDIWLVAYAIQLCMHFDYISRNLENYEPKEERSHKDLEVVAKLVKKHQILLDLANDLRKTFSILVLIMLFSTVVTLFGAAVYVLTQGINSNVLGYLAFLPTTLGQYFMVCYYGQLIINKSLRIGDAAYSQTWYNGCQSYKKSILAILGRSQSQCEINAGGFQTTNLKAFEGVIRMTFQLFAVWRTLMEPK
uniref:Odorant receptor n=1 Tax=Musca domestica TaxID=7370 RepID=A0A1I8N4M4_MUSDO